MPIIPTVEVYRDKADEYRWRLRSRNGYITADSAEGYSTPSNARRAARKVGVALAMAPVRNVGKPWYHATR